MNIKRMLGFLVLAAAVTSQAADTLFRASWDGGRTWTACGDLPYALRYVLAVNNPTGSAEENLVELCADADMATATARQFFRQDKLCYTLRSKTDGSGGRRTLSGANDFGYVLGVGDGQHVVVSNIVFSGGVSTFAYAWRGGTYTLGPGFKASGFNMPTAKPIINFQDGTTTLNLMDGAEIVDNKGLSCAIMATCALNMHGGTIARNTAVQDGAAVCCPDYNATTINIFGGTIADNATTANGGAIYAGRGCSAVNIFGGTITGNRAAKGGAVYTHRSEHRAPIHLSGNPRVTGNTLSDGTTENNIDLFDATQLVLDGPLSAAAAVGVTFAEGALEAAFGLSRYEGPSANADRIFCDLNPVDGATRYGCLLGRTLAWADAQTDPSTYAFRASRDAGATWVYRQTFIEALAQLADNSDCTNNIVEILRDAETGDGPMNGYGAVTEPHSFTFRSGNVASGGRWTLTRNHQGGLMAALGPRSYVFTNVVVTGGTNYFLRSSGNMYGGLHAELREGFALRNCDCSRSAGDEAHPIVIGGEGTVKMFPGSEISFCAARCGSAVYVYTGGFEMYGGTIHSCTSTVSGAAVESNQFNTNHRLMSFSGGTVTNNVTASAQDGGGVAVIDSRADDTYRKWIELGGRVVVAGNRNANGPCDLSVRLAEQLRIVRPLPPGTDVRCACPAATAKGAAFATNVTGAAACGARYLGCAADLSLRGGDDGTGAIVWRGGLVVSGGSVTVAGDATVSFGHADIGIAGAPAGAWTVDGVLTIADGATFAVNAGLGALETRRDEEIVLARATAISGCFRPENCTGIPDGWVLCRTNGELVLRRRNGLVIMVR